jgi:hypothetical protein
MTFGGSQSAVSAPGSAAWTSADGNFAALDRPAPRQLRIRRVLALAAGVALAGAVVWGVLAYLTRHQYSLIALGVGIGIGYVVRRYRRGDPVAAAAAAVLAVVGCVLGTFAALILVAMRDGSKLGAIVGHPNVIVQAYPSSVGSLGIVFWLMAAVAAFTYPMGPQTAGRPGAAVPDKPEPEPSRPPWASKPVPGGFGAPQAPSGRDEEEAPGVPGAPGWGAQPVAGDMPVLRPAARSFAEQIPTLRPPAQPAMGQAQPVMGQAPPVMGQMPPARPVTQPVSGQMRPARPLARPPAQPVTGQMPAARPSAQPVTGQMPPLRPSAQPPSWDLQPNSTARHRAPETSPAEPVTGQWAASQPTAASSATEQNYVPNSTQNPALPRRQRPVGRHRSPSAGSMD